MGGQFTMTATTLQRPTLRTTWIPLGLAAVALLILNMGLYARLGSQPANPQFEFPYYEDFSAFTISDYNAFGGDWVIRDEALVQLSTSGYDLMSFVPINIAPEQPYVFETTLRFLGGSMGGGVIFNAQQTTSRQKSHMARFNVDMGQLWLIYGYFGEDSDFVGQGSAALDIDPNDPASRQLIVQIYDETYSLFVDGVAVALDVPLMYHGGSVGFISATSQIAFDDVRVDADFDSAVVEQPAERPLEPVIEQPPDPDTQATVFADTFDGTEGESLWQPISGDWRFADGAYIQGQPTGFDLSTIYQRTITYPLSFGAVFQHQQGGGGGLLFNLSAVDSQNNGQMVRFFEDGNVLAWGYFDANGVFNGQGSAPVASAEGATHTLEVLATNDTYAIYLDDTEVATDIPINSPTAAGYIGLTASQSVVAFDAVTVSAMGEPSTTVANIDAEAANGNWVVDDGVIQQTDTENTDYVAGTGLAGEQFTVSVRITLPPDNPDAGGGIVFHMGGRDDPHQGYMVRFGSGGQEIFWGRYNADGVFMGEGGVPLNLMAGEAYQLLLNVREDSFDIQVNDDMIVGMIPLESGSGWIGLVSFGGPITFTDIRLQLGG